MLTLNWIIDTVVQVTLLLLLASLAALIMHRASGAQRHLVWLLTLTGVLVLPLLGSLVPRRQALLPTGLLAQNSVLDVTHGEETPLSLPDGTLQQTPVELDAAPPAARTSTEPASTEAARAQRPTAPQDAGSGQTPAISTPLTSSVQPNFQWPLLLVLLWSIGAVIAMARLVLGLRGVQRLERESIWLQTGALVEAGHSAQRTLGLNRPVIYRLAHADADVAVPLTWGCLRPVVLLPAGTEQLPQQQQRTILLHELAHVARNDWAALIISGMAGVLYWFHPLVWCAARALRAESERATDDRVLAAGIRASEYGECLLQFARTPATVRPVAGATSGAMELAIPMAQASTLEKRLRALFDVRRSHRRLSPLQGWLSGAVACAALLTIASLSALSANSGSPTPGDDVLQGPGSTRQVVPVTSTRDNSSPANGVLSGLAPSDYVLRTHSGMSQVFSAAFSPDGTLLATGVRRRPLNSKGPNNNVSEIYLWDVRTRKLLKTFQHKWTRDAVQVRVAFSPDGTVVAGEVNGHTKLWNLRTGKLPLELKASNPPAQSVGVQGTQRITVEMATSVRQLVGIHRRAKDTIISPTRTLTARASGAQVQLIDARTQKVFRTLRTGGYPVHSLAFSPDGKLLAGARAAGVVRHDVSGMKRVRVRNGRIVRNGTVARNDMVVRTEMVTQRFNEETMWVWDVESGRLLQAFSRHTFGVNEIAISPDGKWLASASDDGTVRLTPLDVVAARAAAKPANSRVVLVLEDRPGALERARKLPPGTIQGIVHDFDLLQLVNELRRAGARAIAINGIKLTESTAIYCEGPNIFVGDVRVAHPYRVEATGDADALRRHLSTPYGILDNFSKAGPVVTLTG